MPTTVHFSRVVLSVCVRATTPVMNALYAFVSVLCATCVDWATTDIAVCYSLYEVLQLSCTFISLQLMRRDTDL